MPRKYDRMIRYYASWFDDLLDPTKELTAQECWGVIIAIRDCQLQGSLDPLEQLPIATRRALSMATLGEQVVRMLERSERMRNKSSEGGNTAAANRRTPEQIAAAKIRAEKEAKEAAERDAVYQEQRKNATNPMQYVELLKRAAAGDQSALMELRVTQEQAKNLYERNTKNQKGGKV